MFAKKLELNTLEFDRDMRFLNLKKNIIKTFKSFQYFLFYKVSITTSVLIWVNIYTVGHEKALEGN